MSDLRKAAEELMPILDRWKMTYPPCSGADLDKVEALRQALAQPEQKSLGQYPADMMAKVNSLSISDGDKPRALRFAEMLMNPIPTTTDAAIALELRRLHEDTDAAIALELRRLHEENEALRQAPLTLFLRRGWADGCGKE